MKQVIPSVAAVALCFAAFSGPADASRIVTLVVGGQAADGIGRRVDDLKSKFFNFGDDAVVLGKGDADRTELATLQREFAAHVARAGVSTVIIYVNGATTHNDAGEAFLIPKNWTGDAKDLLNLTALVKPLTERAGVATVMFVDDAKTSAPAGETMRPGLRSTLGAGRLQFVYQPVTSSGGAMMLESLESRLTSSDLPLMRLASLVQEDVSIKTGGEALPRLTRSDAMLPKLSRSGDLDGKAARCVADRNNGSIEGPSRSHTQFASTGPASDGPDRPQFWFCPSVKSPPLTLPSTPSAKAPDKKKPGGSNVAAPDKRSVPKANRVAERVPETRSAAPSSSGSGRPGGGSSPPASGYSNRDRVGGGG